jgi:hypothetical protein
MQVREVRHTRGASLASRALPIQRKSINSFSTRGRARGRRRAPAALAIVMAALASACAGGSAPRQPQTLSLAPLETTIGLTPNQTREVRFRLSSGGVPISGQTVLFTLRPAAGTMASSETLGSDRGTTDAKGIALVKVTAGGAAQLILEARADDAVTEVEIIVVEGTSGTVLVAPFFAPGSESQATATGIQVLFFADKACRDLVPVSPPAPTRPLVPLAVTGGTAAFPFLSVKGSYAIVARALAHERTVATGCVDLLGSALAPGGVIQLALPLNDVVPDPVGPDGLGVFAVTTQLCFAPPLLDAAPVADGYRELSDCPFDPAQLLLDCTIDALSPAPRGDPLDCIPPDDPADGGPVAAKLAAHRGLPIVDGAGVPTGCRGGRDVNGEVSFDAIVLGLFGSPKPALLVDLPGIADDAAHLFEHITLASTLEIAAESVPGTYSVSHSLASAEFRTRTSPTKPLGCGSPDADDTLFRASVGIASYPVPIPTAHALATTVEDQLIFGEQGFTLRLGSLARAAFVDLVGRRGSPGGATGLMTTLTGLAQSPDGKYRGCAALDHALCERIGEEPGCLVNACGTGVAAYVARLDGAFDALDGPGLDLYLSGSATLHDTHNDGAADRLGASLGDPNGAGAWRFELGTTNERRVVSASFVGVR